MSAGSEIVRTLVVHTGGIGDFLLTLPALGLLAGDGPVELLGRPGRLALAVTGGLAKAAHDIDKVGFESVFVEPNQDLRAFLARFDRAVVWMRDDGAIADGMRACGVEDVRTFPGVPPDDWPGHASEYYASQLGFQFCPPTHLAVPPGRASKDIVIHPGSGGTHKNCPMDRFAAVTWILRRKDRHVTWCVGPAEEDMELPDRDDIVQVESLEDLAQVLASTRLYIGNDSGITHLAAAVGCRTVAVFGPTDPAVWGPRGEHVTIVQGDPWPTASAICNAIDLLRM